MMARGESECDGFGVYRFRLGFRTGGGHVLRLPEGGKSSVDHPRNDVSSGFGETTDKGLK